MEKFKLELTPQELDTVYRALLEIPMKFSLPVVQSIETQVKAFESKVAEETKVSEPEVKPE